jgi:hypothetical protein
MSDITVSYEPFKEIVILEKTYFKTPDDLARFISLLTGGKVVALYWVDGVIFFYNPLTSSAAVAKELLEKRKVYWTWVSYAVMPQYKQIIETKEKIIMPVVDMASDSVLKNVAKWLKEQVPKP